jgi:predicted nuclease of restriction endonuclease-like (RecB) superfamily
VLIHQIENQSYEKTLLGQTNFDKALTPGLRVQAKLAVKDEYTFDFLELGEERVLPLKEGKKEGNNIFGSTGLSI